MAIAAAAMARASAHRQSRPPLPPPRPRPLQRKERPWWRASEQAPGELTPAAARGRPPRAQVFKGRRRGAFQTVAIKCLAKLGLSAAQLQALRDEIAILQRLKHENVVQLLDKQETADQVCLITELAQGARL